MQVIGIIWHVYILTGSAFSLAFIGLARFIPFLLFSLLGGITSDLVSRKKIIFVSHILMGLVAFSLAILTQQNIISTGSIFLLLALNSIFTAFDSPARQSIIPLLVPREELVKAYSLNTMLVQSSIVLGPAIGGFLIAYLGVGSIYFVNAFSFLAVVVGILFMGPLNQEKSQVSFTPRSIFEGFRFVFSTPLISSTTLLDFFATFFSSAMVLMPIFAHEILRVGPQGLGFLYAAPAVGSIVAGLVFTSFTHMKNQGKIIIIAVALYGTATILFGLSRSFYLSLFLLGLSGIGDGLSTIIRNSIRQLITPDHLRGRMSSVTMLFFWGGPQLGEVEAGLVAGLFSAPVAVITGGVATLFATFLIDRFTPQLRKYQGHEHL